jgi:hypothetical protein
VDTGGGSRSRGGRRRGARATLLARGWRPWRWRLSVVRYLQLGRTDGRLDEANQQSSDCEERKKRQRRRETHCTLLGAGSVCVVAGARTIGHGQWWGGVRLPCCIKFQLANMRRENGLAPWEERGKQPRPLTSYRCSDALF